MLPLFIVLLLLLLLLWRRPPLPASSMAPPRSLRSRMLLLRPWLPLPSHKPASQPAADDGRGGREAVAAAPDAKAAVGRERRAGGVRRRGWRLPAAKGRLRAVVSKGGGLFD